MNARPLCAVCGRPVDRLEEQVDSFDRVVFRAYCHGEVERVVLDPGIAFATTRRLTA